MRLRERAGGIRQKARATRAGRLTLQIVTGTLGAAVIVVGIFLIPLPGPGWLIVLFGLAILAAEFVWAERLLTYTRDRLRGWWNWVNRQHLVVRLLIGAAGLVLVAVIILLSVRLSFGAGPSDIWDFLRH
jgi:uncharacterized protein (TIGR02611 family)